MEKLISEMATIIAKGIKNCDYAADIAKVALAEIQKDYVLVEKNKVEEIIENCNTGLKRLNYLQQQEYKYHTTVNCLEKIISIINKTDIVGE